MNRLDKTLASCAEKNRKALVTYIVSGDPRADSTVSAMNALVSGGADVIELGVPFSDPMAEGMVIQKAHERALAHNTSLKDTLNYVTEFRKKNTDTPVVLMGYANPVERMGYSEFALAAKQAGVDALLTVDLPPEEATELDEKLLTQNIQNIFLLAPTSSRERIEKICKVARGFVYYVSVKGVTGTNTLNVSEVEARVNLIKQVAVTPVLVGFGIKDANSAKAIGAVSDGVVVGSVLVNIMSQDTLTSEEINAELSSLVRSMREALDELK